MTVRRYRRIFGPKDQWSSGRRHLSVSNIRVMSALFLEAYCGKDLETCLFELKTAP